MEKLVRIINQGPLVQNDWTNRQGEKSVISSVTLTMTDGIDTFQAEVTDQAALNINSNPLNPDAMYAVQCRMSLSKSVSRETGEVRYFQRIRVLCIIAPAEVKLN